MATLKALVTTVGQQDFDARRQVRALYAALDELPQSAREAFVLYELEGYTLEEISNLVGSSVSTVSARLQAARRDVRRATERRLATRPVALVRVS